jgi:peptide deformylase
MIYPILAFPDPVLKKKSVAVNIITEEIRQLVKDMAETMYNAPGIGLAAPQIGVLQRVIVIDIASKGDAPQLISVINPTVIHSEGEVYEEEGCLSVPDFAANVKRHEIVTVKGLTIDGQERIWQADGLLAVAFQHEIDHLDGVLFIDRLSPLKRELYTKKIRKKAES